LLCTRSKAQCTICPLQSDCAAYQNGRVALLPTPRPRKALPEKHGTFLLLLNGSDILLEKRPGSGIWGGLWCPPQLEADGNITEYCMRNFGVDAAKRKALPVFTHTFTHFRLHIAPLLAHVDRQPRQIQQPGRAWLDVEAALSVGIPSPVRKMVEQIIQDRINE